MCRLDTGLCTGDGRNLMCWLYRFGYFHMKRCTSITLPAPNLNALQGSDLSSLSPQTFFESQRRILKCSGVAAL